MDRMGIGEFARASELTAKALRLYDELGLLPPAAVDPHSGYRSYDAAQLGPARLIAALRGVGMPLERIRVVRDLAPRAAAVEVATWWRGVEADVAARREQAALLVDAWRREDPLMSRSTPSPTGLDAAARRHRGLVRAGDDDAVLAGARLFAVADGFGEPPPASSASAAALAAIAPLDERAPGPDPVAELADAVASAARAVTALGGTGAGSGASTGTTLTAMLWCGARFGVAHVGDSRLLRLRGGELAVVTHDHTYPQSLVDEGRLTPDEAAAHPERARLVRALHGPRPDRPETSSEPDLHLRDAAVGDRYLLCTDGLHAVVEPARVREVLGAGTSASDAVDALVAAALDAGGPDNVGCVVVDVVSPPD